MNKIISQMRAYRKIAMMSQDDLAVRIGVSRKTIVLLEQNGCTPSLLLAYKIAKFFHCAVEDVFLYQKGS